jgi:hypothetical protein
MHFESDGGIWKPGGSEKSIIGGGGIACADTLGATVRMASTVKPAFESNENVLESLMRLTFPPCYFICVRGAISVTLCSVPKTGITQKTLWGGKSLVSASAHPEERKLLGTLIENRNAGNTVFTL